MEPHRVLTEHYRSADEKRPFLRQLFDRTAVHYDAINRWGFFGSGAWYRRDALKRAGLKPGMRVLDVASGTGSVAQAAVKLTQGDAAVVCLDPSGEMLRVGKKTLPASYVQGEADFLPVRDEWFDFLSMGFALRHVTTLESAFREYHRVLKPNGRALILEVTRPASPALRGVMRFYMHDVMSRLSRWCTGNPETGTLVQYYWDTVDEMVPPAQVLAALEKVGFREVQKRVWFGMFTEYHAVK